MHNDINESLREVPKVTSLLRHQFIDVYAMYALSYYFTMFAPYLLLNWLYMKSTERYSIAFSNVPGLLKPIEFKGKKSRKMQVYFIPAGYTGVALSCISYVDYFKITLTVDETIMKDPHVLLGLIEKNILNCYVDAASSSPPEPSIMP